MAYDNNAYIAFTKLLARVDWQTGKIKTGIFKLSALTNIKPGTLYGVLKRLESQDLIKMNPRGKYSEITVVNWSKYQDGQEELKRNSNRIQTESNTINKNKRIKELNKVSKDTSEQNLENSEIVKQMINRFEDFLGFKLKSMPSQERSARSIIKRLGEVKAISCVEAAISCQDDKYAPQIANLVQLDKKLDSLLVYYRKNNNANKMEIIS